MRSLNNEVVYRLMKSQGKEKIDPEIFLARIKEHRESLNLPELTEEMIQEAKNEGRP